MSNIDYKAEVMKLRKTIKIIDYFPSYNGRYEIYLNNATIATGNSEHEAWQNAYETLKKGEKYYDRL